MNSRWAKFTLAQLILGILCAVAVPAAGQSAFEVSGSGGVETNCLVMLMPGCTVVSTGPMTGTPALSGDFILRLDTGSPTSLNGYPGSATGTSGTNQGVCVPASFDGVLTQTGGDTINFNHAGVVCEEATPGSAYLYHGTFRLTGGTGQFAAATGGGSVVGTFTREGAAAVVYFRGMISY